MSPRSAEVGSLRAGSEVLIASSSLITSHTTLTSSQNLRQLNGRPLFEPALYEQMR